MSTVTPPQSTTIPAQPAIVLAPPKPVPVPLASLPLRRITVDEYERITDAGVLDDPERVELIDGYMVMKMAKKPGHRFSTVKVRDVLAGRLPAGWFAWTEQPVRIPAYDEPEPDVAVIRGSLDDYRDRNPEPAEVGLIVEVSLTTLDLDRGQKLSAYATDGIPVYWIVNLVDRQIEVYTAPSPGAYQTRADYKPGQSVPVVIDGLHLGDIAVDDILP
jgi:Uma2 family endonuclease